MPVTTFPLLYQQIALKNYRIYNILYLNKVGCKGELVMMNVKVNDPLEVYVDNETLVSKKSVKRCVLCNGVHETVEYKGRNICRDCINELKSVQ